MNSLVIDKKFKAYPIDDCRCLFVSTEDPFNVIFFLHDKKDEEGFGSKVFEFELDDGQAMQVKGPWSSNPSYVKEVTGLELEEYLDDDNLHKFRLVGLVPCERHVPVCNTYWSFSEYRHATGYCTRCGKAIYGLYNKENQLVERNGP